jgi:hypothetical protein
MALSLVKIPQNQSFIGHLKPEQDPLINFIADLDRVTSNTSESKEISSEEVTLGVLSVN